AILASGPAEQISVAGLGARRADAESEQVALLTGASGELQRLAKALAVDDVLVARQHHDGGVGIFLLHMERGEPDGGRGVARRRLDQKMLLEQPRQEL